MRGEGPAGFFMARWAVGPRLALEKENSVWVGNDESEEWTRVGVVMNKYESKGWVSGSLKVR